MTTTTDRSELLATLSEGIAKLTTSDEWQLYLDCQSRFYRYSPNNVMLIAHKRHEATMVAGFNAWKKHGRFVRKGEKAIWILAPMVYKASDDEKSEENERVIRGFKLVPVFDIASTDGEELPTVCQRLPGDDPAGLFSRLADRSPVPIESPVYVAEPVKIERFERHRAKNLATAKDTAAAAKLHGELARLIDDNADSATVGRAKLLAEEAQAESTHTQQGFPADAARGRKDVGEVPYEPHRCRECCATGHAHRP
jgi:hypothetical protein